MDLSNSRNCYDGIVVLFKDFFLYTIPVSCRTLGTTECDPNTHQLFLVNFSESPSLLSFDTFGVPGATHAGLQYS